MTEGTRDGRVSRGPLPSHRAGPSVRAADPTTRQPQLDPIAPKPRLPRLYRTLLALALVLGPLYWMLFTPDGQRRTDLALLSALGRPAFDAALEAFSDRLTEPTIRATFPALALECAADTRGPFGERRCTAAIGSFNQYPARAVAFYFQGEGLRAVKVLYQPAYHARVRAWMRQRPGRVAAADTGSSPAAPSGVVSRSVAAGTLLMKDGPLGQTDEAALLWISDPPLPAWLAD